MARRSRSAATTIDLARAISAPVQTFARRLRTRRLELVPGTLAHLDAELAAPSSLALLLTAEVPEGWPPGLYDAEAIAYFRERLIADGPSSVGWYGWYAIVPAEGEASAVLVASGGYAGPPKEGVTEIGYSVVETFRGRGFATEMVEALVEHAFSSSEVTRVIAHTMTDNVASQRVLRRLGFHHVGDGTEAGTWRFALEKPTSRTSHGG